MSACSNPLHCKRLHTENGIHPEPKFEILSATDKAIQIAYTTYRDAGYCPEPQDGFKQKFSVKTENLLLCSPEALAAYQQGNLNEIIKIAQQTLKQ
jgi:hypothetical protein